MNTKKIVYSTKIDNKPQEQIVVAIKDGYNVGDELIINSTDINYTWNAIDKSLFINTSNTDSTQVLDILSLIQIKGMGEQDRFIDVKMITNNGEQIDLTELTITPNSVNTNNLANTLEKKIEATEVTKNINNSDYLHYLSNNDFIVEEDSLNFLPQATEESLPILISKLQNGEGNGDVYKIIKNSFQETDRLEIWGYNLNTDKIDIQDFVKDLNNAFDYSVNNRDLELNLHTEDKDYSLVFKDVDADKLCDSLDEAISHIIVNSIKVT